MQNKVQFKLETAPAHEVAPRADFPESLEANEKDGDIENRIVRYRRKANFAFRLTAVHSSRIMDRTGSSEAFSHASRPARSTGNNHEAGIQVSKR